jgi:hypothetical protein
MAFHVPRRLSVGGKVEGNPMRACATCAEFEQLLEKTSTDYWDVVLRRSGGVESERVARLRATKAAMDEALERYKRHREAAHSVAASSAK